MKQAPIFLSGCVLAGMILSGCSTFQTSTSQSLPVAAGEKPVSGKALILVDGSDSWGGIFKLYAVKIYDNKTFVGKVGPHGKLAWERNPGSMNVSIESLIGRTVAVKAGGTYRYRINCNGALIYSVAGPGTAFDYLLR